MGGELSANARLHNGTGSATYYPPNTNYAVLVPQSILEFRNGTWQQCTKKSSSSEQFIRDEGIEISTTISVVMGIGLLFLLMIAYRSMHKTKWDFFRITALYIVGTLGVPISVFLGPRPPGFNRIEGFGILVHNFAEWFIVGSLWIGTGTLKFDRMGFKAILVYVWVMLTMLSLMPELSTLFLLLMIQGASLDWIMSFSFALAAHRLSQEKNDFKYFWIGFAAALTHILSIQPLFFGFALGVPILDGITVVFLVPTFMLYILFSTEDSPMPATIIGPPRTGLVRTQREALQQLVNGSTVVEMRRRDVAEDEKDQTQQMLADEMGDDIEKGEKGGEGYNPENPSSYLKMAGSASGLITHGMVHRFEDGKKLFWIFVGAGILTATLNALIVWFSPRMFATQVARWARCKNA